MQSIQFPVHDKHDFAKILMDYSKSTIGNAIEQVMGEEAVKIVGKLNDEENTDFKLKNVEASLNTDCWLSEVGVVEGGGRWNTTFQCRFYNDQPDHYVTTSFGKEYRFGNMTAVRLDNSGGTVYPVSAKRIIWYECRLGRYITRSSRANSAEGHRDYKAMVDNLVDEFIDNFQSRMDKYYDS